MNKHQLRHLKALRMKAHDLPRRAAQHLIYEALDKLRREKTEWGSQRYPYGRKDAFVDAHEAILQEIDRRPLRKADMWMSRA